MGRVEGNPSNFFMTEEIDRSKMHPESNRHECSGLQFIRIATMGDY
jgi:hypothetical protein